MAEVQHRSQKGKCNYQDRGMHIDSGRCWLCGKRVEGVMHLASGCQMQAGNAYLKR